MRNGPIKFYICPQNKKIYKNGKESKMGREFAPPTSTMSLERVKKHLSSPPTFQSL